ncbi:MAG: Hpt domain-containing protein, partial [Hylemonella sp.]|nr:Hpt domain-containing protein [Hylemonella sp.]
GDGQQAYELWQAQDYSLILSDIQMPRMDGRALATAVRQTQAQKGRPSIPIISISANVTEGHEINQVFDFNLIKPTTLTELDHTLRTWLPLDDHALPTETTEASATADAATPQALPLWDPAVLPSLVGDAPAMHQRLLKKFLLNVAQRKTAIEAAMTEGQVQEVSAQAHALKSAARSIGAMRLGELCFSLEEAGRHGNNKSCEDLVREFDTLYAQSEEIIRQQLAPEGVE